MNLFSVQQQQEVRVWTKRASDCIPTAGSPYQPLTAGQEIKARNTSWRAGKWENTPSLVLLQNRKLTKPGLKRASISRNYQTPNQIPPILFSFLLSSKPKVLVVVAEQLASHAWVKEPESWVWFTEPENKDCCNPCFGSLLSFQFIGRFLKVKDWGSVRMSHLE